MKLIYIAGPYRGDVEANILAATRMGQILKRGQKVFPIVPHCNGDGPDDYMLAGTMALMRRCDAVLALPTWQSSQGAVAEIRDADARGLPVFYSVDELYRWVDGKKVGTYNGQRAPLDVLLAGLPQTMLLRHAGRSQEVRHWRKEADDGLLYEAHTIEKVKIVSDTGAVFEEPEVAVAPGVTTPESKAKKPIEPVMATGGVVSPKDGQPMLVTRFRDAWCESGGKLSEADKAATKKWVGELLDELILGSEKPQSTPTDEGVRFMVRLFHPDGRQTRAAQHLPNTRAEFVAWFKAKKINGQLCPFCPTGFIVLAETTWSCASCKRAGTYPELAQQGT